MKYKSRHLDRLYSNLPNKTMTEVRDFKYRERSNEGFVGLKVDGEIVSDEYKLDTLHRCIYYIATGLNKGTLCGRMVVEIRKKDEEIKLKNVICRPCSRSSRRVESIKDSISQSSIEPMPGRCVYKYRQGALAGIYCGNTVNCNNEMSPDSVENVLCDVCRNDTSRIIRWEEDTSLRNFKSARK